MRAKNMSPKLLSIFLFSRSEKIKMVNKNTDIKQIWG